MDENLDNLLSIGAELLEKEEKPEENIKSKLLEIDLFENVEPEPKKQEIESLIHPEEEDNDICDLKYNNYAIVSNSLKQPKLSLSSPWAKKNINNQSNLETSKETHNLKIFQTSKDAQSQQTTTLPFFGIRVSKPLVSSQLLQERMEGKDIVTMVKLKKYVLNDTKGKDWVVGGVIVSKSASKVNQKGNQFSIWTISDLTFDLKIASLFLFGKAHKELWKSAVGTVFAVLNPSVLEKKSNSNEEATLSISNPQHVMILGHSKDLGSCKSTRKDGTKCTAFVNTNHCEYCIYHVKKEYQKSSQRSELQSNFAGRGLTALRNKVLGKNEVFYAGKSYTAIPGRQSDKLKRRDEMRLNKLSGLNQGLNLVNNQKLKNGVATSLDVSHKQKAKDLELLKKLSKPNLKTSKSNESQPSLNNNKAGNLNDNQAISLKTFKTIDFNSISHKKKDIAKINAIKYVQKNGLLPKSDPMNTKGSGIKRPLNESDKEITNESKKSKNEFISDRFKKIMAASSKHLGLFEEVENDLQDKYFKKLEVKEQMEEKMSKTYKVDCKAVRCLQCKYTSFSALDKCKEEKHPLKVFDTVKRFFKCKNCQNRTVVLTFVPVGSCKNCGDNQWEKTSVMKEKKVENLHCLSIRGGEQTFLNSGITNGNLDLLVTDE